MLGGIFDRGRLDRTWSFRKDAIRTSSATKRIFAAPRPRREGEPRPADNHDVPTFFLPQDEEEMIPFSR